MALTNQHYDAMTNKILNIDTAAGWNEVGTAGTANTVPKVSFTSNVSTNAVQIEIAAGYRSVILQCEDEIIYSWSFSATAEISESIALYLNTGKTGNAEIKVPRGEATTSTSSMYLILAGSLTALAFPVTYRLVKG